MKQKKNSELEDYIYIRLSPDAKARIKDIAKGEGSNMTIWVRQLVMKALEKYV